MMRYATRVVFRLAACTVALSAMAASAQTADELTDLPLERLLETEVVNAARFAGQMIDSASAVSVLTAEEIRIYGLRTLAEVLDQMRGLHVRRSAYQADLHSRGIGGTGFASRVLMLIDGNPQPDNIYEGLYLSRDGLLDVALIDRVEYAPGSGSAIYGNNALLGVINIVTKRGRDIQGLQAVGSLGERGERDWRISAGRRQTNGLEWLASITGTAGSLLSYPQLADLFGRTAQNSLQLLLKAQWEGFSALLASGRQQRDFDFPFGAGQNYHIGTITRNQLFALGHDSRPTPQWRLSLRGQAGRVDDIQNAERPLFRGDYSGKGRWWAMDVQAVYTGWASHQVALGARLRRDPVQRFHIETQGEFESMGDLALGSRRSGFSAEDQFTLSDQWTLVAGVRADQRDSFDWTWSPRVAAIWQPDPRWSIKASRGRSTRYRSAIEAPQMSSNVGIGAPQDQLERATTTELVSEYRSGSLRLLGSLYDYALDSNTSADLVEDRSRGKGAEIEAEWQARGWRLRGSHAWQTIRTTHQAPSPTSPPRLLKLQLSAPLRGEALRFSATWRRTATFNAPYGEVPASNRLDLLLVSQNVVPGLQLRTGVRNLLEKRQDPTAWINANQYPDSGSRQAWIELSGTFR